LKSIKLHAISKLFSRIFLSGDFFQRENVLKKRQKKAARIFFSVFSKKIITFLKKSFTIRKLQRILIEIKFEFKNTLQKKYRTKRD